MSVEETGGHVSRGDWRTCQWRRLEDMSEETGGHVSRGDCRTCQSRRLEDMSVEETLRERDRKRG